MQNTGFMIQDARCRIQDDELNRRAISLEITIKQLLLAAARFV